MCLHVTNFFSPASVANRTVLRKTPQQTACLWARARIVQFFLFAPALPHRHTEENLI